MDNNSLEHATPLQLHNRRPYKLFSKALLLIPLVILLGGGLYILSKKTPLVKKIIPFINRNQQEFKLAKSYPEDYDKSVSVRTEPTFVFTKKIDIPENKLSQYVSIHPAVQGSWHKEQNGKVIYFSSNIKVKSSFPDIFKPNSLYTITIKKNIFSESGNSLAKDITITFRTKGNEQFAYSVDKKLINTPPGKELNVGFFKQNSNDPGGEVAMKATIYESTKEEVLNYFSYLKGKGSLYSIQNKGVPINKLDVPLKRNEGQLSVTLPPFEKSGIYYVVVSNSNGEDDFFVTVSSYTHHAVLSDDTAEVWSTDGSTGKRIDGVKTEAYTIEGKPKLSSIVTGNSDGLATYTGIADILVAQKDNNTAFIYMPRYNKYLWRRTSDLNAFSYTDRPVYRPGDTVHYKAIVRSKKNSNYAYPVEKLYLKLLTQSNLGADDYKEVTLDSNGTVTYDLKLPQSSLFTPTIILAAKDKDGYLQVDSRDIKVESYRKPDIDIEVITNEKEYISSDAAHMTLSAKTMYGEPMSNVSYSYRVLAIPFTEVRDRSLERLNEYTFYGDGKELAAGKGKFDESGRDAIEFSSDLKDLPESQIITLEVVPNMAISPSVGRMVKLVHRGEFALFVEDVTANIDDGIKGTVYSLNHHLPREPISNQQIELTLYKDPYERKQIITSQSVTSSSDGSARFELKDIPSGTYELGAKSNDARGNTVTSYTYVYVSETKQKNPNLPTYFLELHTDKDLTKAGENVTVTGKANYPISDALVIVTGSTTKGSVGGASIMQRQVVAINSNTISFPLNVPHVDTPLSVSVLSSHDGEGVVASTDIKLETEDKRLSTTIRFNKSQVKPRENVKAEILTTQNGKPVSADTSLSIVDKAILEIGKFNAVVFDAFYANLSSSIPAYYNSTDGIYNDRGPGGAGGCFAAGTQILMRDGTTRNIEDMKIGDGILTRQSDTSSQLVSDKVTKVWRHIVDEYIIVNETFKVTPVHRVFINNTWTEMSEARVGDLLLNTQGNSITITSLRHVKGQYAVYNLTTEKYHTFFADGFYVHNEKGPGPRQNFADTIYWNPHIKTNTDGRAEITFTTPDNITTFTAQAFSNTVSAFGQANAELIAKKDLVIIPAVPTVIYQGDKPVLSAVVQNTTDSDVEGSVSFTIKDLNVQKEQEVNIKAGAWSNVRFPVEIDTNKQVITINFALKGTGGSNLDEIQLTKKVIPQGNVLSSWFSFTGSKNFSFTPQYKDLDSNNVTIFTYLHPATVLTHKYLFSEYVDQTASVSLGEDLYFQAYLLEQTQKGLIDPSIYNYPLMRDVLRENLQMLFSQQIKSDQGIYWVSKYNPEESPLQIVAWLVLAIKQMQHTDIAASVEDIDDIIRGTEKYVSNNQTYQKPEDMYLSAWVLNKRIPECAKSDEYMECLSVQVLQGDNNALQSLKNMKLETADDRYMWNTRTAHGQVLPALAMIRKGTAKEADKAIKGLAASFNTFDYDSRELAYVAAIDHALRNNLTIVKPTFHITANGNEAMDLSGDTIDQLSFDTEIPLAGLSGDSVEVSVRQESGVPIYTDVVITEYSNNNKVSISAGGVEREREHEPVLIRKLRKINGTDANTLDEGESGIVELSMPNLSPSSNSGPSKGMAGIGNAIYVQDAISPGYMFLNQASDNSPQYQSALFNIYKGEREYEYRYVSYANYSDQFVTFRGIAQYDPVVAPYVVYKMNKGSYYQPKTTAVYPQLGVVIREK